MDTVAMRFLLSLVILFVFSSTSFAGKIKSSESLLPQLESEKQEVLAVIAELKIYIDGIGETGSFIKNDFWGFKPTFYLGDYLSGLSNIYFMEETIHFQGGILTRNINNISLNPYSNNSRRRYKEWDISIDFNYSDVFAKGGDLTSKSWLQQHLQSNNIDKESEEAVMKEYIQGYLSTVSIVFDDIIRSIDKLYSGIHVGYNLPGKYLEQLFKKDIYTITKHLDILKKRGNKLYLSNFHEIIQKGDIKTTEAFITGVKHNTLLGIESLNIPISMRQYYFTVGAGMEKAIQRSQIIDFDLLLEKKVSQGKAVRSTVTIKRKKYIVYSDMPGSVKYPASVFFDKETGDGIWQIGYWKSKEALKSINQRLQKANNQLISTFTRYLKMKLSEAMASTRSKIETEQFSDEF